MKVKVKVAFICVHNACRSQMAEAIARLLASDTLEVYSAGIDIKPQINQHAVTVIKKLYDVDMNETQKPKTLSDIPQTDIVVTMGCGVPCSIFPGVLWECWTLEDPTGKGESEFVRSAKLIEEKVLELKHRIDEYWDFSIIHFSRLELSEIECALEA